MQMVTLLRYLVSIPDNTGLVSFRPDNSWFVDTYRGLPGKDITGLIINAPYTNDTDSVDYYNNYGIHSVKSGYFYELQGRYQAIVTTTVYTRGGDISHADLVQSVIDGFRIVSDIPTVNDPKDKNEFWPYYDKDMDNMVVNITRSTTTSDVSQMSDGKYGPFMEQTGDKLYFEQLSSLESLGTINKVTETTVITFDIPKQKSYLHINAADQNYFIKGYLTGFSIPNSHIGGSYSGDLEVAELPKGILIPSNNRHFFTGGYTYFFRVEGNMYEDTNQGE